MSAAMGSAYLVAEIAGPLALVISLGLRWLYLRAVWRSMLRPVVDGTSWSGDGLPVAADPPARPLEMLPVAAPTRAAVRAAGRGQRVTVAVHAFAGVAYALTITAGYIWAANKFMAAIGGMAIGWRLLPGTVWFCMFYAWPVVIVVSLLMTLRWRAMVVAVVVFAAVFVGAACLVLGGLNVVVPGSLQQVALAHGMTAISSISVWHVAGQMWFLINGVATLLVLAFLVRPIRAIGPVVLALAMAGVGGAMATVFVLAKGRPGEWLAWVTAKLGIDGTAGNVAVIVVVLGAAGALTVLLGYLVLRGVGALYRTQRISDQSIQVYMVWLIFALAHRPPPGLPYMCLVAFGVYVVVARLGLRLFGGRGRPDGPPPRLLLLRVFSLGRRGESLFGRFSPRWRYTGPMLMVGGPDLAAAAVEPHEFLDFLAGRLQRQFITGPAALEQRLATMSPRPDPDHRFRVFEFFCHTDSWQPVLRRLVGDSDVVMMDLRGFTAAKVGCIFELHALLDSVRLDRVLLVVDDTTDRDSLTRVLHDGWSQLSTDSPNRSDVSPCVRLYHLEQPGAGSIGGLVATLAAGRSPQLTAA